MDLMKMMKQAQDIQSRMQKMQEELAGLEVEGQSGAGLVTVRASTASSICAALKIDPSLIKPEEAEMLERPDRRRLPRCQDPKPRAAVQAQDAGDQPAALPSRPGLKLF